MEKRSEKRVEQRRSRRRIHLGRVMTCAGIVGVLAFGIVKTVREKMDTPIPVTSVQNPSPNAIPVQTIPADNEVTEPSETVQATTEYVPAPESMQLRVPYISQKGVLPTGCELISAMMLLRYYNVDASVQDIIDNTFFSHPKTINNQIYAYSPYDAFIGTPYDENSFGCYPPVIVDMLNKLLPEGKTAVNITGMELSQITETYIPREKPVLVWATIAMLESYPNIGWYLLDENGEPTGEWYDWLANEHCLVLVGYDSENYYFNDPYNSRGLIGYDRKLVETRYAEIGKCAVVVIEE